MAGDADGSVACPPQEKRVRDVCMRERGGRGGLDGAVVGAEQHVPGQEGDGAQGGDAGGRGAELGHRHGLASRRNRETELQVLARGHDAHQLPKQKETAGGAKLEVRTSRERALLRKKKNPLKIS